MFVSAYSKLLTSSILRNNTIIFFESFPIQLYLLVLRHSQFTASDSTASKRSNIATKRELRHSRRKEKTDPRSMKKSTHYETLGVSKEATQDEIKTKFRELSLKFHPDLNKEHSCAEKFKVIANAHSVLSSPRERKNYDRQLLEGLMWKQGTDSPWRRNDFSSSNWNHRRSPKATGQVVIETLTNPRYFLVGLAGIGGVALLGSVLGGLSSKRPDYHHYEPLVEAWKNPATGRYEQPAPWDKEYQRLKPKLEMVPRGKVWKRNM